MTIQVCVGSACHTHGSYAVLDIIAKVCKRLNIEQEVSIGAAFCLGHCAQGVSVKFDDQIVTGVTPENAERILGEQLGKSVEK